jgi:translation initiation factor 2A
MTSVKVMDVATSQLIFQLDKKTLVDIGLSSAGNYLSTWERMVKVEDGAVHKNLTIYSLSTGLEVIGFSQKAQHEWNVQWTEDEAYFARAVTNEVHVYATVNLSKGTFTKLRWEGLVNISVSPGKSPAVAVFRPEKNGAPAIVRVYSLTNFNHPLAQKTFFKADKVSMMWNKLGTGILVLAQTEVDKTGKSYYGESNLYYMATAGNYDCRVMLDKEGPIHDIAWSPNSKEFIVVFGFMPAKAVLFDHRANKVHEFGTLPRNYVRFNPQGRLICIAGFGNLAGQMDIWDRKTLKKVSTIDASGSAMCDWSPDGRHLMTAILSPRLRVDNGYRVWHCTGVLVHETKLDELYQVVWKPEVTELFPDRQAISPPPKGLVVAATAKPVTPLKVGAYRPPGARGKEAPTMFKREDEVAPLPTTATSTSTAELSKAALKNQKKREATKKKKQDDTPVTAVTSSAVLTEVEKKIRSISKKLKDIEVLKERRDKGDPLEQTQLLKIDNEQKLLQELATLQA